MKTSKQQATVTLFNRIQVLQVIDLNNTWINFNRQAADDALEIAEAVDAQWKKTKAGLERFVNDATDPGVKNVRCQR